jgi:Sulfotransferase family
MNEEKFTGPFFVVGLPRSGTKLLRDLLNQNPQIGIPVAESGFLPEIVKSFGDPPNFKNTVELQKFFEAYSDTNFSWYMKKFGYVMSMDYLRNKVDEVSWDSIFKHIIQYHVPHGRNKQYIWGDKTPSYLFHVDFLRKIYPHSRFIHIIRDPRECSLSARNAWGNNPYKYADRWNRGIKLSRIIKEHLGSDYLEVKFESLIETPEITLRNVCQFLECEFVSKMMKLGRDTETAGNAKGKREVMHSNKNKYLTQLSKKEIKRIEEITYDAMQLIPYKIHYATRYKALDPLQSKILGGFNKWNRIKYNLKSKGLKEGIKFIRGI